MEQDGQACGGREDMHIAAEMDAENRRQPRPATPRHGLGGGVKHGGAGDVSEDRSGGEKRDEQFNRRHLGPSRYARDGGG